MSKPGFKLYLLWRVLKVSFLVLTSPVWGPLLLLLASAFSIWESLDEWCREVTKDWESK